DITSMGIVDLISVYGTDIMPIIGLLMPENEEIQTLLLSFVELTDVFNLEQPILSTLSKVLTTKDSNSEVIIKKLIGFLMPDIFDNSMFDMINTFVFQNENLTPSNLSSTLDAIANPRTTKNGSTIVRYKEWFDSMTITTNVVKSHYDKETNHANVRVDFKYKFNSNLWIDIGKLKKIIPPGSMELPDGSSLPLGLISTALPGWLAIMKNDYIGNYVIIDDIVNYDVIKNDETNNFKFSWVVRSNSIIDMNLPQSVKSLYDSAVPLTGQLIVDLTKHMFFHEFSTWTTYRPIKSSLNKIIVNDYNPQKKNNLAIFQNFSNEDISLISSAVISNMKLMYDKSQSYSWKWLFTTIKIEKSYTNNTFDFLNNLDKLIDTSNYEASKMPLYMNFTSNHIITNVTILGISIPEVSMNSIEFWTPGNIYSESDMKNSWVFTFNN
ncbi:MAG: hypothetical protein ACRC4L_02885, partial [Mycoplasma sp.]